MEFLEDFFRKNKAEVIAMSIFEYDEKEVIDYIREEERAIGREEGIEEALHIFHVFPQCRALLQKLRIIAGIDIQNQDLQLQKWRFHF